MKRPDDFEVAPAGRGRRVAHAAAVAGPAMDEARVGVEPVRPARARRRRRAAMRRPIARRTDPAPRRCAHRGGRRRAEPGSRSRPPIASGTGSSPTRSSSRRRPRRPAARGPPHRRCRPPRDRRRRPQRGHRARTARSRRPGGSACAVGRGGPRCRPKRSSARAVSAVGVARPSAARRTARSPSRPIQYAPPSSPSRKPWPPMIRAVRSGRTTRHATPVPAAMATPQPSDSAPAWAVTASSDSQTSGASVAAPTSAHRRSASAGSVGAVVRPRTTRCDRVEGGIAPAVADGLGDRVDPVALEA